MPRSKTYFAKPSDVTQNTKVVDAAGQILGRLATRVARTLQGKDKPTYTPQVIVGDRVVITNAAKVRVTGRKLDLKIYYRHSGYVGNLRSMPLKDMMERHPERVIQLAVKGMLPRTTLGRDMLRRLRVYPGDAPG
ncbi:MAG: 50S ribosomal protein L13, partial [Chloroflexota bacterium]|nr:50S ribosomal protein L13 [Chloroflexota bacterium]